MQTILTRHTHSTFIYYNFELYTRSMDCEKSYGQSRGEDLAEGIGQAIAHHGLKGRVVSMTTDREPSSVVTKASRIAEEEEVTTHIGCCNHKLECTTAMLFNGPGVKKAMALQRALVARYTKSSQMAARLEQVYGMQKIEALPVVHDVETRWWSMFSMTGRILYLRDAIELHET